MRGFNIAFEVYYSAVWSYFEVQVNECEVEVSCPLVQREKKKRRKRMNITCDVLCVAYPGCGGSILRLKTWPSSNAPGPWGEMSAGGWHACCSPTPSRTATCSSSISCLGEGSLGPLLFVLSELCRVVLS